MLLPHPFHLMTEKLCIFIGTFWYVFFTWTFLFLLGQDSMLLPHPSDLRRVKPGRTRRRGQAVTGPQSTNTASMEIQRNVTSPENDSLKHLLLQTIERKHMISILSWPGCTIFTLLTFIGQNEGLGPWLVGSSETQSTNIDLVCHDIGLGSGRDSD